LAAGALGAAGCSDAESPPGSIEIMHWWNAGGEKQAIDVLLAEFKKQYPSIEIVDKSVPGGSTEQRAALATRFNDGLPPDTFQANGGCGLLAWVLYNDDDPTLMAPIDDLAEEWKQRLPDEVLDSVSYGNEPDRHVYAVPLNIHRLNTLFYNKDLLREAEVDPEKDLTNLSDLFLAAEKVRRYTEVKTPIALGYGKEQEWSMALLFFENLLAGHQGGELYRKLFNDPKHFDVFDPEFVAALEDLRRLMSYANEDANVLPWDKAMARVLKREAAMTIMGDWAKGYADAQEEEEYRNAYGFVPMPGTSETFVFTTDTFGLLMKPDDQQVENTKKLLSVFGSIEGQKIFNEKKGSISARTDVPIPDDDNRRATFAAFSDSKITKIAATSLLAPQTWVDAASKALATFATDWRTGTPSEFQHTIHNYKDVLLDSRCLQQQQQQQQEQQ
jgi:glucose/mannose transport system substrate-binding protein